MPVAAVVLSLGANDLKARFNATPADIANGVGVLASMIRRSKAGPDGKLPPKILVVCPPPCTGEEFFPDFQGAIPKSVKLPVHYKAVAAAYEDGDVAFLDAGSVAGVVCDEADGIHLTEKAHGALGLAIARKLKILLSSSG